jgi:AcrR family transcriptional regulator
VVHRVLDVTWQQLARVGIERLSIPEIAEIADVNKTSIYRRWPTKGDLVQAALTHSMEHVRDIPDTGSLRGDLVALGKIVSGFVTSARGMGEIRTVFADGDHPEVQALAAKMWQRSGEDIPYLVIERAMARGELPASADVELLLFTIAGAIMHRVFVERADVDDDFIGRLINLVLHGALPR